MKNKSICVVSESPLFYFFKLQTETGRVWFSRLVNAQRAKSKRVDESTFYSLVQYFAIVLFECAESEDFSPAKILMNMCFTFYHDSKLNFASMLRIQRKGQY